MTVTWSLVPDGTTINPAFMGEGESNTPSDLVAWMDGIYGSGPGGSDLTQRPWFKYFDDSFERWDELSGITYTYEPNDDGVSNNQVIRFGGAGQLGVRGDVRIGAHKIDGNSGILAYNYFPTTGDMVLDSDDSYYNTTSNDSRRLRNILMHEAGHGLGLSHLESNNSAQLMEPFLNTSFYGPQLDDIQGVQRIYGDALEKNGGNDTAATATDAGTFAGGETWAIGSDAPPAGSNEGSGNFVVTASQTDFVSIDDESDTDFYGFSTTGPVLLTATLDPRGAIYNEGPQGGSQSSDNAAARSDLALALLTSDGSATLDDADATGLGQSETIVRDLEPLQPGDYAARVTGATTDALQLYRLELAFTAVTYGDSDIDGDIDITDFNALSSNWAPLGGETYAWSEGDFDDDDDIDITDFNLLSGNWDPLGEASITQSASLAETSSETGGGVVGLEVDLETGAMTLRVGGAALVAFQVVSAGEGLLADGASDPDALGFVLGADARSYAEAGLAAAWLEGEYLLGATYDYALDPRDLAFSYLLDDQRVRAGSVTYVPEPAAAGVVLLSAVLLLRRRRA